jgi:uncharacterized membrane protein
VNWRAPSVSCKTGFAAKGPDLPEEGKKLPRNRNKNRPGKATSPHTSQPVPRNDIRRVLLQKAARDAQRAAALNAGSEPAGQSTEPRCVDLTHRNIDTISKIERAAHERRSFGERVADLFAATIGSWTFIVIQTVLLAAWVALNMIAWIRHWDPYPFILLNLALSFQAAYAGPIIMMSQNRQSRVSDRRNQLDLQINLLAEQENTEMLRMLRRLCDHMGLETQSSASVEALEQATSPQELLDRIDKVEAEQSCPSQSEPADRGAQGRSTRRR